MSSACWSRPRCRTRPAASSRARARRTSRCRGRRAADAGPGAAPDSCPPPTRCSSTAARAWRGASTSCARPRRLASRAAQGRPHDRGAVLARRSAITGPTDDAPTIADAIAAIQPRGGTAILDSLTTRPSMFSAVEGRHAYPAHRRLRRAQHHRPSTTRRRVQQPQATVYVVGIGGVAGISLKGETLLSSWPTRRAAGRSSRRARSSCRRPRPVAADACRRYSSPTRRRTRGWTAPGARSGLAVADPTLPDPRPRRATSRRSRRRSGRRSSSRRSTPTGELRDLTADDLDRRRGRRASRRWRRFRKR